MNVQAEGAAAVAPLDSTVYTAAAWAAPVNQGAEGFASYAQHLSEGFLSEDLIVGVAQEAAGEPQTALDSTASDALAALAQTEWSAPVWAHLPSMAAAAVRPPLGAATVALTAAPNAAPNSAVQSVFALHRESAPTETAPLRAANSVSAEPLLPERSLPVALQTVRVAVAEPEALAATALESVQAVVPRGVAAEPMVTMSSPRAALEQVPVPVQKGAQPLVQALAQRIQVQQTQGADIATVRLDPPQMGSLEIRIRQEGAAVQVHLQASHSEVGRQLTTLVETLRQELQQRSSEVQVTVAQSRTASQQGGQGGGQGQQQSSQEPVIGQALEANGQAWTDRA